MNLLGFLQNRAASSQGRQISADARKALRRRHLALDFLEERKVLSTVAPSNGTFEGINWSYSENSTTHVGTLNFVSKIGKDAIHIEGTHSSLNPSDPGYVANSTTVNSITWIHNDDEGAVVITPGTHVNINVQENYNDDQFVNDDLTDFTLNNEPTDPFGPPPPARPPVTTPPVNQQTTTYGDTLGLDWRLVTNSNHNPSTLYIQSVTNYTNAADRNGLPIAINQDSAGHVLFGTEITQAVTGPTVPAGSTLKIVVAQSYGDINIYDDRNVSAGGLTKVDRVSTGRIDVANGRYLNVTTSQNIVTQQAVVTIESGASDKSTYYIAPKLLNLSPSDPGYVANKNPVVGLDISDSQGNQGGVSFLQGMSVTIVTKGGALYNNSSTFVVTNG